MIPAIVPGIRIPLALTVLALLLGTGCATQSVTVSPRVPAAGLTPPAEEVSPREAWTLAAAHAAAAPGREVMVGSGNSMMPLYRDRTVLVVEAIPLSQLRPGMTVVYIGDSDRPVAHTLIENTASGWIAMGVGNSAPDRTRVQQRNYIGAIIRAFSPNPEKAPSSRRT